MNLFLIISIEAVQAAWTLNDTLNEMAKYSFGGTMELQDQDL